MTRILPLLALLALLWLAPSGAALAACEMSGAPGNTSSGSWDCDTKPEAWEKVAAMQIPPAWQNCNAKAERTPDDAGKRFIFHTKLPGGTCGFANPQDFWTGFATYKTGCPNGAIWNDRLKECQPPCSDRAPQRSGAVAAGLAYTVCSDGCEWSGAPDPASPSWHIETPTGAQCKEDDYSCPVGFEKGTGGSGAGSSYICVPKPDNCPAGQTRINGVCKPKPDECPAGKHLNDQGECEPDKNDCPAGKVKAPDGTCTDDPDKNSCPTGQTKGSDGTCKPDADGDGDPDGEGEETGQFGDSTDCARPPMCSGDKIMCGQVLIQWRIECNTRKRAEVSGGVCGAPPVCTGDGCGAVEVATLRQQWKTACELEKLNKGGQGGDAGQPEWTKVGGMGTDPGGALGAGDADGAKLRDGEVSEADIDSAGWIGGGGSCPSLVSSGGGGELSSAFASALANPDPSFCNWIGVIGTILVILTSVGAVIYMAKGGA